MDLLFTTFMHFLLVLDVLQVLLVVIGLLRIKNRESFFYRILTPVEVPPSKIMGLSHNKRVVVTAIILFFVYLFWVICPDPRLAWTGLFATSAVTFLCFRKLAPGQFVTACSVVNLNYMIAFYAVEFMIMFLLSMMLLIVPYLINRYVLSRAFKSERTSTSISIVLLALLVLSSLMATLPISYRLKGLGWF